MKRESPKLIQTEPMPEKIKFNPEESGDLKRAETPEHEKNNREFTVEFDIPGISKNAVKNSLEKNGGPLYFLFNIDTGKITLSFSEKESDAQNISGGYSLWKKGDKKFTVYEGQPYFSDPNLSLEKNKLSKIDQAIKKFFNITDEMPKVDKGIVDYLKRVHKTRR